MKRILVVLFFTLFGVLTVVAAPAQAPPPSSAVAELWDPIAKDHIRPGRIGNVRLNVVDYSAIKADPRWPALLDALARATEPVERKERLAFWINAYNIMAIKVVLSKYPVASIKDVGGWLTTVWDIKAGTVAGKERTLTEIEHKILRKMGEPRIHAAIVCASVSCPPIRAEAYTAEKLDDQLNDQMKLWLGNEHVGAVIENDGETLRLSPIFKWFAEDFEAEAGSVRAFVVRYLPETARARLKPDARIVYLNYDWSINDARHSQGGKK
ncbi:MAG: DUF547 domain-containing protein [Candidatus Sumerlaeia bacterium]